MYTTYRVMAADLVDAAARALGVRQPSVTRDIPLLGAGVAAIDRPALAARAGLPRAALDRLVARYGDRAEELVALIDARPELGEPLGGGDGHLRAEVVHACTHEGALHLDDVLERRTRLALTAPDRGLAAASPAAALMADALGWDGERARREADAWRARVAAGRAAEDQRDDEAALRAYRSALEERADARVAP
jgi:glycerol-3-phosphate dehydrogenase